MIIQTGLRKNITHKRYCLGAHPIIQHFMDKLKINEIMGSYLPQDQRMKLSVEKTLSVIIHNILTNPIPLYEISDWLTPLDEEKLNLDPGDSVLMNDDRVAKALEHFYNSRHKDIFFRLALRAIKLFEIDCRQIHQDTTTVTFSGRYDGWNLQPLMNYGVNKDHRPDLKQLVLGLSVTADGAVPLMHEIYDGHQTDDRLQPANHRRLRTLLGRCDFIYVADCKLATNDNLTKITACGGLFVTVMPRTWKEDQHFRHSARQEKITWSHLLSKANNRRPNSKRDHYYLAKGTYSTSKGYRLLWIKSTQKAQQDKDVRKRHIEKALDAMRKLQIRLNTYRLKTHKNIQAKITSILEENQCSHLVDYQIHQEVQYQTYYKKVGRPKCNAPKLKTRVKFFSLSFEINQKNLQQESLTDGVFPLLTNLKKHTPKEILGIYKYQPFLEKRHSQLKTYQEIAPVFLKKPQRVIAYLHMHVMALMVSTLIERQLRIAMKRNSISSLPIYPEAKPCKYPTMFDIVRLFKNVEKYEVIHNENILLVPAQLNKLQKQILQLLEAPISLYQ